VPVGASIKWRWVTKDAKYVLVNIPRERKAVFGGSHWFFVPIEAIIGVTPRTTANARARALCRIYLKHTPNKSEMLSAVRHPSEDHWGNVAVCGKKIT
jgi:hypothetical protein